MKINEINGWKNFKLIPLFKLGRHHLNYDSYAFWQLLCSLEICPLILNKSETKMNKQSAAQFRTFVDWNTYLNFTARQKKHEYGCSFKTDGVACSITFLREKKAKPKNKNEWELKKGKWVLKKKAIGTEKPIQIQPDESQTYIGIDPGNRLFLGGVRAIGGDPYQKQNVEHIKYSSRKYHYECGKYGRKLYLEMWTQIQKEIEKGRPAKQSWFEYILFQLKYMVRLQKVYLQAKVTRLNFDHYIRRSKTISKIIKDVFIKDEKKKVVLFYGDASQPANSPMKGYTRVPHKKMIEKLKQHPQIIFTSIPEYNTTKVCSSCLTKNQHVVSSSPHRFSFCKKCKIVWNRDVNAGLNMLYIGFQRYICNNAEYSIRN
jgi:transposase